MKSYLSLIPISAKTRRKQNRLTLICIILAVFLVTSVFSFAEIMIDGENKSLIRRHGDYHIIIDGISKEEASQIAARSDVSASAWYAALGKDAFERYAVDDVRIVLYGAEQSYMYDIRKYKREGVYPKNDNEVMLSIEAKERFGVHVGDTIVINTPTGDYPYTISGFCADDEEYNHMIDGVCAYMSINALENICAANEETRTLVYYIQFAKKTKFKKAIDDIKAQYGLQDGNIEENTMVLGSVGASSNTVVAGTYGTAIAVFVLVLIAGVLMISGCMNSNVARRIKFFGMLRCIGASRIQVMRYVRLEALNWCKSAVPIGCALGVAVTYILCAILKNLVRGEFVDYSFQFSLIGIISGALVGVITVLLAAHSPAKRAAGVSPMAAVSGNADAGKKISHAANTRLFKIEGALGIHHAVAVKRNLLLMSLSFALMVALFLVFFAGIDAAKRLIPSESNFTPDISIAAADNANSMDKSMKMKMDELSGVEAVFGCAICYDTPADINGVPGSVDLVSYDDYMFHYSKKSVVSGDIAKITNNSDYALIVYNRGSRLDVGDKIKIGDTELEIACVVSEGIGGNEERPLIVLTEETFTRITGEEDYILVSVALGKGATEETIEAVRDLAGENEFADRREENSMQHSSFWVFRFAGYGFLTIISLITVFNIMNSISMSVSARMKQYGAMRAVGMSAEQMIKMIGAEAATYAVCGLLIGCAVGLYLNRLLITKLIIAHFGGVWKVPLEPLSIIIVIVTLSCVAAVYAPAKRMYKMEITETISEIG